MFGKRQRVSLILLEEIDDTRNRRLIDVEGLAHAS